MNQERDKLESLLFSEGSDVETMNVKLFPGDGKFSSQDLRDELAKGIAHSRSPDAVRHAGFDEPHLQAVNIADWAAAA